MTLMAQRRLIETMAVKRTPEIANITTNYRADMKKSLKYIHNVSNVTFKILSRKIELQLASNI